jgi:integrase
MRRFPPYPRRPHSSGRARLSMDRRTLYLEGEHGSAESWQHYNRLLGEWTSRTKAEASASSIRKTGCLSIAEVVASYLEHSDRYYGQSREAKNIGDSLRPLIRLYGSELAESFTPAKLKLIREAMLVGSWLTDEEQKRRFKRYGREPGVCRKTANQRTRRIVRMFRWAVAEELIPAAVWQSLRAVESIRAGRHATARESPPVPPVPILHMAKTLGKLSATVAAMVRVQFLTGMRPGEICSLSAEEIDRSKPVWVYRPTLHKTRHHGHVRQIAIGPRAKRILARFLAVTPAGILFRPHGANARGDRYTPMTYGREITRAAARANVPHWRPNQIRHTAATEVERRFGLDQARAVLGHRSTDITKTYAAADLSIAAAVASVIG